MLTYPLILKPSFSYYDFLMHEQYIGDLKNGIQRVNNDTIKSQALSTKILHDTINKNGDFIANTIDSNFTSLSRDITDSMDRIGDNISQLDSTLDSGFRSIDGSLANISSDIFTLNENVSRGIDQVSTGISVLNENMAIGFGQVSSDIKGFHSDFNIAMGGVLLQFEMQREEMKQGFDSIINILENKRKTDAAEDFRDAMDFYNDGCKFADKPIWFRNAHKHFIASIEKYERNPLAHLHMAHLYHYQEEFRDFDKALEHYELCYTYGEADEKSNAVTAQGYFYAGWLKASVFDDIDSAIELTKQAIIYDPSFSEAYYNLSKYYATKKDAKNSTTYLEKAIVDFDRNYMIKAESDADFDDIRKDVHTLFEVLTSRAITQLNDGIVSLQEIQNSYSITKDKFKANANTLLTKVNTSAKESTTYFSALDTIRLLPEYTHILNEIIKKQKDYDNANKIYKYIKNWNCEDIDFRISLNTTMNDGKKLIEAEKPAEALLCFATILEKPISIDYAEAEVVGQEVKKAIFISKNEIALLYTDKIEILNIDSMQTTLELSDTDYLTNIAYDENNNLFAIETFSPFGLKLYDMTKHEYVSKLNGHSHSIKYLEFSPCGEYLLSSSGYDDEYIRLWDVQNSKLLLAIKGKELSASPVAFSPSGEYFAVANPDLWIYNIQTGEKELIQESASDSNIVFTPNGEKIAHVNYLEITITNLYTENKKTISVKDTYESMLAFSPNKDVLSFSSKEGTIEIFAGQKYENIFILNGPEYIKQNVFNSNGRYIITQHGLTYGEVLLWDLQEIANNYINVEVISEALKKRKKIYLQNKKLLEEEQEQERKRLIVEKEMAEANRKREEEYRRKMEESQRIEREEAEERRKENYNKSLISSFFFSIYFTTAAVILFLGIFIMPIMQSESFMGYIGHLLIGVFGGALLAIGWPFFLFSESGGLVLLSLLIGAFISAYLAHAWNPHKK